MEGRERKKKISSIRNQENVQLLASKGDKEKLIRGKEGERENKDEGRKRDPLPPDNVGIRERSPQKLNGQKGSRTF